MPLNIGKGISLKIVKGITQTVDIPGNPVNAMLAAILPGFAVSAVVGIRNGVQVSAFMPGFGVTAAGTIALQSTPINITASAGLPGFDFAAQVGLTIPAVVYDGVQSYMAYTSGPAGVSAGPALTLVWAGTFNSDAPNQTFFDIPSNVIPVRLQKEASGITFSAKTVFSNTVVGVSAGLGFINILAACSGTESILKVAHAGGILTGTNTPGTPNNLSLQSDWGLGAEVSGSAPQNFLDANTAYWWADNSFIDVSASAGVEQFWDTSAKTVRLLGSDGSNPLDGDHAPLITHQRNAANHNQNSGSGGTPDIATIFSDATSPGNYSPDYIADPALAILASAAGWWEADSGSNTFHASSLTMDQLTDLTGNGNHFTQSVTANKPLVATSAGLTYVDFDGSNDYMTMASGPPSIMNNFNTGGTFIVAAHADSPGGGNLARIFQKRTSAGADSGEMIFIQETSAPRLAFQYDFATTDGRDDTTNNIAQYNQAWVAGARVDKTGGIADLVVNVNGSALSEGSGLTNVDGLTHGAGAVVNLSGGSMYLGNRTDLIRAYNGGIYAMAVFATVLSDADYALVETHFANKAGVTL